MADREAAATGEIGSEQVTGENIEQVDEMAKPMDEDEAAKPTDRDETEKSMDKDDKATGSVRRKPRSTPSISRMKDERHKERIKEQE